jgi:hypothetical protein
MNCLCQEFFTEHVWTVVDIIETTESKAMDKKVIIALFDKTDNEWTACASKTEQRGNDQMVMTWAESGSLFVRILL